MRVVNLASQFLKVSLARLARGQLELSKVVASGKHHREIHERYNLSLLQLFINCTGAETLELCCCFERDFARN